MKVRKISLIATLSMVMLVFAVLFGINVNSKKTEAVTTFPMTNTTYAETLAKSSVNTNFNVVRGTTYQLDSGFTASPHTFEALIRVGSIGNWKDNSTKGPIIGGHGLGFVESFNIEININNHPRIWWRNGEVNKVVEDVTLPQNEWVHFVMVRDTADNTFKFYINGQPVGSGLQGIGSELNVSSTNPSPAHFIGRDARLYHFFAGNISYVGLSSKVMSATEVANAYNNCKRLVETDSSSLMLSETCVPRSYYMANKSFTQVPNTVTATVSIDKKNTVALNNSYAEVPIVDKNDTSVVGYIASSDAARTYIKHNSYDLAVDTNGHVKVIWDPNGDGDSAALSFDTPVSGYTGSLDIRTGQKVHIAVVRNAQEGNFSLYLNGVLASVTTSNNIVKTEMIPTHQIAIGKDRSANGQNIAFPGMIYDVAFYSNAFTSTQVANENSITNKTTINKSLSGYNGLMANWVLNANQQTLKYNKNAVEDLKDYSGNGLNAVLCTIADYFIPQDNNWFVAGEDEYTMIYVPDTQCTVHSYSVLTDIMFDWVVDNADQMNLQFVMGLGDIVDGSPIDESGLETDNAITLAQQWDEMAKNYKKLSNAGILWSAAIGNHDYDVNSLQSLTQRKAGYFNEHFGLSSSTVKDANGNDFIKNSIVARYHTDTVATEADDMLNVIYEHTATTNGGTQVKYLIIALEFGPSRAVLDWANSIVSKPEYVNHRVIFNTHSLIFSDGNFGDATAQCNPSSYWYNLTGAVKNETYCEPDFMWEYFMSKHHNMFLAASGHIETDTNYFRQDQGDYGNIVSSMLCDGQGVSYFCSDGDDVSSWGDPLILVAKVNEKTKTISYRYFNPVNGCFLGVENQTEYDFSNWQSSYNVTWKNYDNTVLETDTNILSGSLPEYNGQTPTKSGYTFMGWATTSNGTAIEQDKLPKVSGDVTYYAIFASNDELCTITWVVDGKTTTSLVIKGDVPIFEGNTDKYGYVFVGWDKTIVAATGDTTYTAVYSDTSVWDGTYPNVSDGYTFSGSGTQSDPWLIQSAKDLAALSALSYGKDYGSSSQYFKLTVNLDLTAANWQPISSDVEYPDNLWGQFYKFGANFDGGNHSVKLNVNTIKFNHGLFGGLSGSASNLTIEGSLSAPAYVGALVGRAFNGATITNVTNKANVTGTGDQIGGLVGNAENQAVVTITNCSNQGNVTSNGKFVGGILGGAWASIKLNNCSNSGKITGASNVGGIIGELHLQGSIQNCTNTGEVMASSTKATQKIGNLNSVLVGTIIGKDNTNTYCLITWVIGTETELEYYLKGETPVYNGTPTKASTAQYTYAFSGWSPIVVSVTGEATYTAQFAETTNTYTITWIVDGKSSTTQVAYGTKPSYNGTPVKAATAQYTYTFSGWSPEVVTVTGEATYTAQFTETTNTYTITWIVDGKSSTTQVAYGTKPSYNGTPVKPATAQYTYTFSGWSPEVVTVTGEATYTAQFSETLNTYTITWIVDGKSSTNQVAYGTKPSYNGTPEKAATAQYTYTFSGWSPEVVTVTGEATYTAQFTETINTYTITWVVDGQEFAEFVSYGQIPEYADSTDKENYEFKGWSTEENGTILAQIPMVTEDATYYAIYEEIVLPPSSSSSSSSQTASSSEIVSSSMSGISSSLSSSEISSSIESSSNISTSIESSISSEDSSIISSESVSSSEEIASSESTNQESSVESSEESSESIVDSSSEISESSSQSVVESTTESEQVSSSIEAVSSIEPIFVSSSSQAKVASGCAGNINTGFYVVILAGISLIVLIKKSKKQ